jgi:uncharacterized membrane protein YtjA (UPF0391 family)
MLPPECGFGKGPYLAPPAIGLHRNRRLYRKLAFQAADRNPERRRRAGGTAVTLLKWALIFFVISIVAGLLGFTGISAGAADIARFLFYVFVVIFLVLLVLGLTIFRV